MSVQGLPQLEKRLRAIQKAPIQGLAKIQLDAVANAKRLVPRKTGNLGRSIHKGQLTHEHAIVIASARYAAFVELGTRPHVIKPRTKQALRFPARGSAVTLSGRLRSGGGSYAFAKVVHHPGTKPEPFLLPGAEKALKDNGILDVVVKSWNEAA